MAEENKLTTCFASPERDDTARIKTQRAAFRHDENLVATLTTVPQAIIVLNSNRQILFANKMLLDAFGFESEDAVLGLRPGEAFKCMHAETAPSGCGTASSCRYCGAVEAVLEAFEGKITTRTASIVMHSGGKHQSLNFEINVVPLLHEGQRIVIGFIRDISDKLRRESFERVFYHDILNLAGLVSSYTSLIIDGDYSAQEKANLVHRIATISEALVEEINHQRIMTAADAHQLRPEPAMTDVCALLTQTVSFFELQSQYNGKKIVLSCKPIEDNIITDGLILRRVISNMIKNALEASKPGDTVTVSCARQDGGLTISVNNPGVMPDEIQSRIFTRAFSTKGRGRGLGTYGMKLLTEDYLGGYVSFTSDDIGGTTFRAALPEELKEP